MNATPPYVVWDNTVVQEWARVDLIWPTIH